MNRNNPQIDWVGWIITIIMLTTFWPVGVFFLIRQLSAVGKQANRGRSFQRHPQDIQREAEYQDYEEAGQSARSRAAQPSQKTQSAQRAQATQRTQSAQKTRTAQKTPPRQTAEPAGAAFTAPTKRGKKSATEKKLSKMDSLGNILAIVGGAVSGLFGVALLATLGDAIAYGGFSYLLSDFFAIGGFLAAGLACLGVGMGRRRQVKRFRKYLAYIGKNQTVSLAALASAMGKREKTVYKDLQEMLDEGILPTGYIDLAEGRLILSDQGISDFVPPRQEAPVETPPADVEDENAILQEIRAVNDAIPDEVMSAKIDRIGEITGKILDYQRSHPNRSGQLRSFLNYYLPTTLKVLRAYAQLDAQGIEGENISAAKKRIENMMDQVVYGFERQLDRLFQDDAMDITSDVEVLENMLKQDGLSGGMTFASMAGGGQSAQESQSAQAAYLDLKKVEEELKTISAAQENQGIRLEL